MRSFWVLNTFITRQHEMVRRHGKVPIVWEEVHKDTVIQVWTSAENIQKTIQKGYKVVVGSADYWYLDCGFGSYVGDDVNGNSWCDPYKTWQKTYSFNPLKGLSQREAEFVLGGEALLWGEQ
ncbi:N-acetyl-glucosamine-6-phosphate deacetylase, partial [Actinomortierella ambigua]